MAEVIFRYIDGVLRPITVNKVVAGQGASAQQRRQVPKQTLASGHYRTAQSFTIPNATCQVCGASVFYYEHPNGARVLFDELGPPWPKHPCYEAGQSNNSKSNVRTGRSSLIVADKQYPNWQKQGWKPLVFDQEVLLQSGKALRVQAHNDAYLVRFEISLSLLKQSHIQVEQVKELLMHAKEIDDEVLVQLHDGTRAIEVRGTPLSDGKNPSFIPSMLKLTQTQMVSLTQFDGSIKCQLIKSTWQVLLENKDFYHSFEFQKKTLDRLAPATESLEAWITKPSKRGTRTVYLLNRKRRRFVTVAVEASSFLSKSRLVAKAVVTNMDSNLNPKPNSNPKSKAERLTDVSIIAYSASTKIVRGKLGMHDVQLAVPNRLFRLGELPEHFTAGMRSILLRPLSENVSTIDNGQSTEKDQSNSQYWLYIQKIGEKMPKSSRGIVSNWQANSLEDADTVNAANNQSESHSNIVISKKRLNVRLVAVDLTDSEKIDIEVAFARTVHRLRLHSISDKVMLCMEKLIHTPQKSNVHLVQRSAHSYQLHVNNRFVVMATEVSVFEQTSKQQVDSTVLAKEMTSIVDVIQENAHLDSHSLGAALLNAVASAVTTDKDKN